MRLTHTGLVVELLDGIPGVVPGLSQGSRAFAALDPWSIFFEEHPPGLPRGKGDVGGRESFLPDANYNTPVKDLAYEDLLTNTFTLASHERGIKTWCVPATYPECLLRQNVSV
jgi:hypothetical protein